MSQALGFSEISQSLSSNHILSYRILEDRLCERESNFLTSAKTRAELSRFDRDDRSTKIQVAHSAWGDRLTKITEASCFARDGWLTWIPYAPRFASGYRLTKIPKVSHFARGDRLTKITEASRLARSGWWTSSPYAPRFAPGYRLTKIPKGSHFARGYRLTKIPLASRFARSGWLTYFSCAPRFAPGYRLTKIPRFARRC